MAILPATCLLQLNPAAIEECWLLLKNLPYLERYSLYQALENTIYQNILLYYLHQDAKDKTNQKLKRLTKDNVAKIGRLLSHISYSQPLAVFTVIIHQLESYENLRDHIIGGLNFYSYLSYDILIYSLLNRFSRNQLGLTEIGDNFQAWFKNLAKFLGNLLINLSFLDIHGLLHYIYIQLRNKSPVELLLLMQLLGAMEGVKLLSNLRLN